jgi:aspartate/methionine/tyrosine aminotransferase
VLSDESRQTILDRTKEVGAWLLCDEVYAGAERNGKTTPSFWGRYDRVIIVNGLSKAYGLPGLRIGWIVTQPDLAAEAWTRHDYTTIGPSGVTDHLAAIALDPAVRPKIIARTRAILNRNYPVIESWLESFNGTFTWRAPDAGAICFARYRPAIPGAELVEKLRAGHNVLLVPGEHFDLPGYIRFGFGNEQHELETALATVARGLRPLLVAP